MVTFAIDYHCPYKQSYTRKESELIKRLQGDGYIFE
jgi:hypothetical protein